MDKAFANFFRRVALKKAGKFSGESGCTTAFSGKVGFPKFKSRRRGLDSFRLTGSIRIEAKRIKTPRLGWLHLKESGYLPTDGVKILSATVSEHAKHWFVSLQVEQQIEVEKATSTPIGVDLGVKTLAVCSDSREFENPKALQKALAQLRRTQRELSRRKKGVRKAHPVRDLVLDVPPELEVSNWAHQRPEAGLMGKNREKSRRKLSRLHYRISNIRSDAIHKVTSSIVAKTKPVEQRPSVVVIEDLNVSGMLKNHNLARAISDVGFSVARNEAIRRQLTYKTVWNGVSLLVADRFFPSSKL